MPNIFIDALKQLSHIPVHTSPEQCWVYGYDNSKQHGLPLAVAFPKSHDDVVSLVQLCLNHDIPVIARGRGTGTTGAAVPIKPSLVISFERMDQIIDVDAANRWAVVQPGVINAHLQDAAAKHQLCWPPNPTSMATCTIGGNLAFNAAGPRTVKYGTPRENCLQLKAVTGTGKTITTGAKTRKSVVGYDLTRLLIGSEGTLAIITEATLKLTPLPEQQHVIRAIYADIQSATNAVIDLMTQPITPCSLEFMDTAAIEMIRAHTDVAIPNKAGALLMIAIDGDPQTLAMHAEHLANIASNKGLVDLSIATTSDEAKKLWAMRKALSPALRSIAPKKINEDIVVPISKVPVLLERLQQFSQQYGFPIVNFGHIGEGNLHVNLLIDPDDPKQQQSATQCLDQIFDLVLSLEGSLSGEHGIGLVKRDFVSRELDENAISLMHEIKQLFDPKGILNPGKGV